LVNSSNFILEHVISEVILYFVYSETDLCNSVSAPSRVVFAAVVIEKFLLGNIL